jgi:hypothetical protein
MFEGAKVGLKVRRLVRRCEGWFGGAKEGTEVRSWCGCSTVLRTSCQPPNVEPFAECRTTSERRTFRRTCELTFAPSNLRTLEPPSGSGAFN